MGEAIEIVAQSAFVCFIDKAASNSFYQGRIPQGSREELNLP